MNRNLNRDWPARQDVLREFGGDADDDIVDQLDATHTCPDVYIDPLNPGRNIAPIPCQNVAGHDGPHHNTRHGVTWGGPHDWNIT